MHTLVSPRLPATFGVGAGGGAFDLSSFGFESFFTSFLGSLGPSGGIPPLCLSELDGAGGSGAFFSSCWSLGSSGSVFFSWGAEEAKATRRRHGTPPLVRHTELTTAFAGLDSEEVLTNSDSILFVCEKLHNLPCCRRVNTNVNL